MLCANCSDKLKECANNGLLTQEQLGRITDELSKRNQNLSLQQDAHLEAKKTCRDFNSGDRLWRR
jgi:hypothetical protein